MTPHPPNPTPGVVPADQDELLALSRNLRRLATRLVGDSQTADDLVQEAWLAALDEDAPPARDLAAWLRGVVRRLAVRQRARSGRRAELERLMAAREAAVDESRLAERLSIYHLLRSTIESLREPYADLLLQRYFEERSVEEIAQRVRRPESTVRSQLSRGMAELREALDRKHHGDRSAWSALLLPWTRAPTRVAITGAAWIAWGSLAIVTLALVLALWRPWRSADESRPAAIEQRVAQVQEREAGDSAIVATPSVSERTEVESTPADVSAEVPSSVPTSRELEVRVLGLDGVPATEVWVRVLGRPAEGPFEGDTRTLSFELDELIHHERSEVPGVRLAVRSRTEAWSPTTFVPIPPEGRSVELRTRGRSQGLHALLVDEAGAPIANAGMVVTTGVRQGTLYAKDGISSVVLPETGSSDERGRLVIEGLLHGAPHEWFLKAPGYVIANQLSQGEESSIELTVVLERGGTLHGIVRSPDGSPVAGARVFEPGGRFRGYGIVSETTITDADGRYSMTGLAPGPQHVFACAGNDETLFVSGLPEIEAGVEARWDAQLAPFPGLKLRLLDSDGAPIPDATLGVFRQEGRPMWTAKSTTDVEGRVHFAHAPNLAASVLAKVGVRDSVIVLRDAWPRAEEYSVEMELAELDSGSIRGVLLGPNGPLLERSQIGGVADFDVFYADVDAATGEFRIESITARTYALQALVNGLGAFDLGEHEVRENATLELGTLHLPAPVKVRLEWRDRQPTAEEPWSVKVQRPNPEMQARLVRSIEQALPELQLLPGTYCLGPLDHETCQELKVGAGGEASFEIE